MDQETAELIERGESLPHSLEKVQVLEEAIRRVDGQQDLDAGFHLRGALVNAASWIGRVPEALTAFTWQLGQADADPERFPDAQLFFQYQWIISDCVGVPSIPRGEILQMLDDLESRLQRNGLSLRSASHLRWRVAMRMGDLPDAVAEQRRWRTLERDQYCFDVTCECDSEVELLIETRRDAEALVCAEPILTGKYRWPQAVPEFALGNLLISCVRLGKIADAHRFHKWGYSLIRSDHSQLYQHTRHLLFLVWVDELTKAFQIFRQQLPRYCESASPGDRSDFLWATGLLLRKSAEQRPTVELDPAAQFGFELPAPKSPRIYDSAELGEACMSEAMRFALTFDARNGNSHMQAAYREEEQLAES